MAEEYRRSKSACCTPHVAVCCCAGRWLCTPGIQQESSRAQQGSGEKQGLLSTCLGQPEHRLEPAGQADKLDREGQKLQWRINSLRRRERWVRYTRREAAGLGEKKFTSPILTFLSIPSNEGIERRVSTGEVNANCGEATALGGLKRVGKPKPATVWIARKNRKKDKSIAIWRGRQIRRWHRRRVPKLCQNRRDDWGRKGIELEKVEEQMDPGERWNDIRV